MSERRRITIMALIMITACVGAGATAIAIAYGAEKDETRNRLRVTVQSQARLIESIARHEQSEKDESQFSDPDYSVGDITLSQVADAHRNYVGFGDTGEFTMARLEGDSIVFLLGDRPSEVALPDPVANESVLAEPMRRALDGLSGTMIGLDYRGKTVIAAYEPLEGLPLGLVAKIDLSEIRWRFVPVILMALFASLVVTLVSTLLFVRVGKPVINQLQLHSRNLEREIEDRKVLETALIEREKEINAFFNSSEAGLVIIDKDLKFIRLNRAAARIHGIPVAEHMERSIRDVLPAFSPNLVPVIKKVLNSARPVSNVEVSGVVSEDPEEIHYWTVDYFPLVGPGGATVAVGGVIQDVTEKKENEAALRKWEAVFRHAGWGVVIAHPESHKILAMNPAFAGMHGYSIEEAQKLHLSDLISEEDHAELPIRTQLVNVSGREVFDSVHVRKDGTRFPVLADVMVIRDEVGKILYRAANYQDITESKAAENALRKSEMMLLRAEELAHVGHWTLSVADSRLELSDEIKRISGYEPDEYNPTLEENINCYHPDDIERVRASISNIIETGQNTELELRLIRPDGELRHVYSRAEAETDKNGNVVSLYGVFQDITERKKIEEEQLILERQMLQDQKLESLGVLAGGIAHDFNNLLMTILGNADLVLQDLAPKAAARGGIQAIEKAARRAAGLSKQMLAYSGQGKFVLESIELTEFLEGMSHLLDVSRSKEVVLKYDFKDSLPTLEGDPAQIQQVILNLVINASEAIGDGSGVISISTGALECDRDYLDNSSISAFTGIDNQAVEGMYVYLEVADTGCGIDREIMEKIFDPFFTTKKSGRGLGMAAVYGIVRGHKGSIMLNSEPGKGSTFRILFPASPSSVEADSGTRGPKRSEMWRGEGTILAADDEESVLSVCRRLLERMGFTVITANDGLEAVEKFRENREDIVCVLLDVTMPRMDGSTAFKEIIKIQDDARVILCSGYTEKEATQHLVGQGFAGFLHKPYSSSELKELLMDTLSA